MSDLLSSLSERELAELSAFADGTLPPERRAEVQARVAASPELLELVERQRRTVAATQALSTEEPPESLVATSTHSVRGASSDGPARGGLRRGSRLPVGSR